MKTRVIFLLIVVLSISLYAQNKIRVVKTYDAPEAIGPYSQAIESNGFLFLSGQIAADPSTNQITGNDIESQTKQIFKNIKAVLKAAGTKMSNVVKCTVFMVDLNDFSKMNKLYEEEFEGHKPARSTVQVARLPKDVLIEIECIAIK
jgi:2-iminobutanoate/2-iminopropanoate deaminase